MVAVADTQKIETLLAVEGQLLLSDEYITTLTKFANAKLLKARERIEKLRVALESIDKPKPMKLRKEKPKKKKSGKEGKEEDKKEGNEVQHEKEIKLEVESTQRTE
jgi:hypothetical protein